MRLILVIADDLTGAAEIAGVGLRHGLTAELVPGAASIDRVPADADLVVLNVDSRAIDARAASMRIRRLVPLVEAANPSRVYKKIDSVLRGNVQAEIEAWVDESHCLNHALLVPHNPSRGRTIDPDGTYRIDGVPLNQTAFARDPDHPRTSARPMEHIAESGGIARGTGTTFDDIRSYAASLTPETLPVGGADFFHAILERDGHRPIEIRRDAAPATRTLFVSGTADAKTRATLVAEMRRRGAPYAELPIAWFAGDPPPPQAVIDWAEQLCGRPVAALLAPDARVDSARVHALLCDAAAALIDGPIALFVDGGATAMVLCRRMGWASLRVVAEVGPGAVTLAPSADVRMTIKPGSYAWPDAVWADLKSQI